MADKQTILPPNRGIPGWAHITAYILTGGRGVVGNTTFAFWAAAISSVASLALTREREPDILLVATGMPWVAYFLYLGITWWRAPQSQDAAMAGDDSYATVIAARVGAKHAEIVRSGSASFGAVGSLIEAERTAQEGGSDDA